MGLYDNPLHRVPPDPRVIERARELRGRAVVETPPALVGLIASAFASGLLLGAALVLVLALREVAGG